MSFFSVENLTKKFGGLIANNNISMEVEKNCGFVTFDRPEAAEAAIAEHNGSMVAGIEIKVSN